ncbi:hypothetical protein KMW28_21775 [Flammeovirga yaeyamensis]|uniref:Transcriptional regulator n=1 Tax=Flammeovirga yaeyamensis TaxID=367791 RepID=A0AAX1NC09_9BACT|nr:MULTISPECIES: hypothetical protein [Flammeovirga]ANQ52791.2 hypothetical protein MY04_5460 [Flammeovirga sp. MY04]MBB3697015.1 NAD-dependent DNA ligase [Flammeovirga yaeyamensis]NMF33678.1 hypothetical protein [Flammeovirga yaeyamensis]QWG05056.1 hypothetical protein KMW28_21775 [Flammeovirga yaeyamensis]
MSKELKTIKLLAGICLSNNISLQTIVRQMGIQASTFEIEEMVEQLFAQGYISNIEKSPKGVFCSITSTGTERAQELLESAI